jgi:hypothetical protein
VKREVESLLKSRIVIGHSPEYDFAVSEISNTWMKRLISSQALKLVHPPHLIRDTSTYPFKLPGTNKPYRGKTKGAKPRLKYLAKEVLGRKIQVDEHDSVRDCDFPLFPVCVIDSHSLFHKLLSLKIV